MRKIECKNCRKVLKPLNPPVEEYLKNKFCIKIFGWKLMLLKDWIEYGCPTCILDEKLSNERDNFNSAVGEAIESEIKRGNLVYGRG